MMAVSWDEKIKKDLEALQNDSTWSNFEDLPWRYNKDVTR
jgi:hypothetical protein